MSDKRRAYWSKLIGEQEASGASIRAFCKQRGIGDHSFYLWRRRLREQGTAHFALLKPVASGGAAIELFLSSGERLCISTGVDTATLRSVLEALRS